MPTLKPAWKRDMIECPSRRSTSAPSTFIATSQVPLPKPSKNRPTATGATPSGSRARRSPGPTARTKDIALIVRAAPSLEITTPASGIEISEPIAIASSSRPSCCGSSSSPSRTCGIRDAQLANAKPLRMKTA